MEILRLKWRLPSEHTRYRQDGRRLTASEQRRQDQPVSTWPVANIGWTSLAKSSHRLVEHCRCYARTSTGRIYYPSSVSIGRGLGTTRKIRALKPCKQKSSAGEFGEREFVPLYVEPSPGRKIRQHPSGIRVRPRDSFARPNSRTISPSL